MGNSGATTYTHTVELLLNGKRVRIENPDPSLLLADYLRSPQVGLTGTKVACGEGGCGACTVVIARRETDDTGTSEIVDWAINACLRPVCTLDGTAITTIEGLGGTPRKLHPIQEQVVACDATQCGFCTPGFIMNMYGLLRRDKTPEPQDVEDRFDGNLCRCTGYRPILDAMHAFDKPVTKPAAPPDPAPAPAPVPGAEATGEVAAEAPINGTVTQPASHDTNELDTGDRHVSSAKRTAAALRSFKDDDLTVEQPVRVDGGGRTYLRPLTLADALDVLKERWAAHANVKIMAGGTSIGVFPAQLAGSDTLLDVSHVRELRTVTLEGGTTLAKATALRIGGSVTFARLLDELDALTKTVVAAAEGHARALLALSTMVRRIASQQVRSMATVGGNLMLMRSHVPASAGEPFPSDFATAAAALDATVLFRRPEQPDQDDQIKLYDVLASGSLEDALPTNVLVTGVRIPLTSARQWPRMYKVARREQCAHAIVNAGLVVELDASGLVTAARFVFGGIRRAPRIAADTAQTLVGKPWTKGTFDEIGTALLNEILDGMADSADAGASKAYRASLAVGLVRKFFIDVAEAAKVADAGFGADERSAAFPEVQSISDGAAGTVVIPYRGVTAIPWWLVREQPLEAAAGAAVMAPDGVTVVQTPPRALSATTRAATGQTTTTITIPDTVKADEDTFIAAASPESMPPGTGANGANGTNGTSHTTAAAKTTTKKTTLKLPPPKISAAIQATGEARYTVDEFGPPGTLHAVYVYSMARHARFKYRLDWLAASAPVAPVVPAEPESPVNVVVAVGAAGAAEVGVAVAADTPVNVGVAVEAGGPAEVEVAVDAPEPANVAVVVDTPTADVAVAIAAPPADDLALIDAIAGYNDNLLPPPEGEVLPLDLVTDEADPYDILAALKTRLQADYPAFRGYITAYDIPRRSENDIYNGADPAGYDPTFAMNRVTSYGQPIGVVVSDTVADAKLIATRIQQAIEYYQPLPVVKPETLLTIRQARSSLPLQSRTADRSLTRPGSDATWLQDHVKGETPLRVTTPGKLMVSGRQRTAAAAHFYLEPLITLAIPGEDGTLTLYAESQSLQTCQNSVAWALKMHQHDIRAKVSRLGGSYGGKERPSVNVAVAAAVAAHTLRRPVRLALDRHTDMTMVGKQHPFIGEYWAVVDTDTHKIEKMRVDLAVDTGCSKGVGSSVLDLAMLSIDSAYEVPTLQVNGLMYQTNVEPRAAFRSFGVMQSTLILEEAIERIARGLGVRPEIVREASFYPDRTDARTHRTHFGQELRDAKVRQVWEKLKERADLPNRYAEVDAFNTRNRWRKRGISTIPIKYGIGYTHREWNQASAEIVVYRDGTVLVHHGGVEMGQGLDTKIKRIAARVLGIQDYKVRVAGVDTGIIPNASTTGSSTGTDLVGGAVLNAAQNLRTRLERFWKPDSSLRVENRAAAWQTAWNGVVKDAYDEREPLIATGYARPPVNIRTYGTGQLRDHEQLFYYFTYGAAATEVEIDVLTGESIVRQSDVVYDAGQSVDPFIDIGQIEGAFVQGIGTLTSEQTRYADDGRLITNGTWEYKPPFVKSIPRILNVHMLRYDENDAAPLDRFGVLSSKATGEPPLVLATTAFFAIKHAILAARQDHANDSSWFDLDAPATTERIRELCTGIRPG
jgi:xanthine dehydrogenase small subunit